MKDASVVWHLSLSAVFFISFFSQYSLLNAEALNTATTSLPG
jgi:hypothetical protein